jgi:hypothetical protein
MNIVVDKYWRVSLQAYLRQPWATLCRFTGNRRSLTLPARTTRLCRVPFERDVRLRNAPNGFGRRPAKIPTSTWAGSCHERTFFRPAPA